RSDASPLRARARRGTAPGCRPRRGRRSARRLRPPRSRPTASPPAPRAGPRSARSRAASSAERASELPQDPEVAFPEQADIGDVVAQLGCALEPAAEREPGPALRVDADVLEHLRIDDAGAAHLDPAGVLARPATRAAADPARHVGLD